MEALNTKEEETKLKLGQAVLTTTRIGLIKRAVTEGRVLVVGAFAKKNKKTFSFRT